MGQKLFDENIGILSKTSITTASLAASIINIGGQQYITTTDIELDLLTSGLGGLDTGSIVSDTSYNVFTVVSNNQLYLLMSLAASPSGVSQYKLIGTLATDGVSQINTIKKNDISIPNDLVVVDDVSVGGDFSVDIDMMFVDQSTGRVGIGTSSPRAALHVNGDNGELLRLGLNTDVGTQQTFGIGFALNKEHTHPAASIYVEEYDLSDSRASLLFATRGDNSDVSATTRMTIDSNGNVGIGTSIPSAILEISDSVAAHVVLDDTGGVLGGAMNAALYFRANGSPHGLIGFSGTSAGLMYLENKQGSLFIDIDSANASSSSYYRLDIDGVQAHAIDQYQRHTFGDSTDVEPGRPGHYFYSGSGFASSGYAVARFISNFSNSGQRFIDFSHSGSTVAGAVSRVGTTDAIQLVNGSDRRIKDSIESASPILDKIMDVKIREFYFKNDTERAYKSRGVIAQELFEVFPEKVQATDDGFGDNLSSESPPWTVGESWHYELIKAIQEQQELILELSTQITELQAEVAILKGE